MKAIKLMASQMIELAVMDEAAAIDGSRPLKQIADSSGITWGGTSLQMTRDLTAIQRFEPGAAGVAASDAGRVCTARDQTGAAEAVGYHAVDLLDGSCQLNQAAGAGGRGREAPAVGVLDHRGRLADP